MGTARAWLACLGLSACSSLDTRPMQVRPVRDVPAFGPVGAVDESLRRQEPGPTPAPPENPAPAAPEESPWHRASLGIGGFLTAFGSEVRLGAPGAGLSINLEEALDLDSSTVVARVDGYWRFTENRRHRFDLSLLDLGREASAFLGTDITLPDGTVLPVGTEVRSELDLQLIKAGYSYSFLQDDRIDIAVGAGFYVAPIDFAIHADSLRVDESFDITAPLPVIGTRFDVLLAEDVYLRSRLDFFYLQFDDYRGSIRDLVVAVEWDVWDHVGVGLGFDAFGVRVQQDGPTDIPGVDFLGRVDLQYAGLLFYLKGFF